MLGYHTLKVVFRREGDTQEYISFRKKIASEAKLSNKLKQIYAPM